MLTNTDFENIALSKSEYTALKYLKSHGASELDSKTIPALIQNHLVNTVLTGKNELCNPIYGKSVLINVNGLKYLKYIREKKLSRISSDLRGWITTVVAVAALLKSFWPDIMRLVFGA